MGQQYRRRDLLRIAAATSVGTILAACGGATNSSPTTSVGGVTPTIPPATASPSPSVLATPAIPAATTAPSTSVAASSTIRTGTPTPPLIVSPATTTGQGAGTARATAGTGADGANLLRMLAFIPNQPKLIASGVTFANLAAVKALNGLQDVRSKANLQANQITYRDFRALIAGCALTEQAGLESSDLSFRDLTGYDLFQVDRQIAFLNVANGLARLEGAFDSAAIAATLQKGAYTSATYQGATFLRVRDDDGIDFNDPLSSDVLDGLNRVVADNARVTCAPNTALIQTALDTEAKRIPTLDANPTWRALADAFGDILSMATFVPNATRDPRLPADGLAQFKNWSALHSPELVAMGYTDDGKGQMTTHAALVYATPADAKADATELVTRIQGYVSAQSRAAVVPTLFTSVTTRVVMSGGKGVLVADMPQAGHSVRPSLWYQIVANKDTIFLATEPP